MLSDLSLVSKLFLDEPESSWFFNEIVLDDEAIEKIKLLSLGIELYEHSARIKTSPKNHAYIPCHYFLYALKVRPLALLLREYVSLKESLESTLSGTKKEQAEALKSLVTSLSTDNRVMSSLDVYSREHFFNFFNDSDKRLGAKEIINSGKGVIRSDKDIFGSVILKALPVPDTSSGVLGQLIDAFSKSPEVYEYLVSRYGGGLPYIFKSNDGDELLYLIFVTLGLEDHFNTIMSGLVGTDRVCAIGTVADALLLNKTPVPGNSSYFETPVHYSTSLKKYVFFKKGLLDDGVFFTEISNAVSSFWSYAVIDKDEDNFYLKSHVHRVTGACNTVIYGAPGTGKSHSIEQKVDEAFIIRTVFHPDTQFSDFVGALKPRMSDSSVIYEFRPGPFTRALVRAMNHPQEHVSLVIEEINRAPAAAVFGELFQLLDRDEHGASQYTIDASDPDMLDYINVNLHGAKISKLTIPSNLSLLATMNSSDQAVMPLDTAFKRRWSFEYLKIDFDNPAVPQHTLTLKTQDGRGWNISWADFADKIINAQLKSIRVPEDRLLGPFFLDPIELASPDGVRDSLAGKLFVYLWDDVLRHKGTHYFFASDLSTFGELHQYFTDGSRGVFCEAVDELIKEHGIEVTLENTAVSEGKDG